MITVRFEDKKSCKKCIVRESALHRINLFFGYFINVDCAESNGLVWTKLSFVILMNFFCHVDIHFSASHGSATISTALQRLQIICNKKVSSLLKISLENQHSNWKFSKKLTIILYKYRYLFASFVYYCSMTISFAKIDFYSHLKHIFSLFKFDIFYV